MRAWAEKLKRLVTAYYEDTRPPDPGAEWISIGHGIEMRGLKGGEGVEVRTAKGRVHLVFTDSRIIEPTKPDPRVPLHEAIGRTVDYYGERMQVYDRGSTEHTLYVHAQGDPPGHLQEWDKSTLVIVVDTEAER